nr:retrovirus-related Pol polyprotein from transposon TNT 1-94 [Tanacetum cinerariifolium]
MVKVKVLMTLANDNVAVSKEGAINDEWVKISTRKCISKQIPTQKKRILGVDQLTEDPSNFGKKDLVFVKYSADDTKVSIPAESQVNRTNPPVAVTDSLATDYDSTDESSVCSTPLPLLEKLAGTYAVSGPKTIKLVLKSNSTFKAKALKSVTINEPSLDSAKVNNKALALKTNSAPAGKLKNIKCKDDLPLAIVIKELHDLKLQISKNQSLIPEIINLNRSYDHDTDGHNRVIFIRRGIKPRNPQHVIKTYETYGSTVPTTTDHNDIEWFRRDEALEAKKATAHKSNKIESSNASRSKTPTKSGCSSHMTDVKSYLYKYVKQPGPKVVFRDDSTCTNEGYDSIKCNGIIFTKVAFLNGLKYNLINISQLCDAIYTVQFDEKEEQSSIPARKL